MQIEEEWGGATKSGWKAVPVTFLQSYSKLGITAGESMLIIVLHSFIQGKQRMFPKIEAIARVLGKSNASVKSYIRSLRAKGFLITKQRRRNQEYIFTPLYDAVSQLVGGQDSDGHNPQGGQDSDPPLDIEEEKRDRRRKEAPPAPARNKLSVAASPLGQAVAQAVGEVKDNRAKRKKKPAKRKSYSVPERKDASDKPLDEYTGNDVGQLLQRTIQERFGYFMGSLTGKDRGQLKRMVAEFGSKESAVAAYQMVAEWEAMRTKMGIKSEYPTVAILYGYRKQIVPWSTALAGEVKPGWGAHFSKEDERPDGQEIGWGSLIGGNDAEG